MAESVPEPIDPRHDTTEEVRRMMVCTIATSYTSPFDCLRLPSVRDTAWLEARFGHS